MNRDFFRPALLVLLAVIFTGVLAWLLPAWSNDFFSIRKMKWFTALKAPVVETDSLLQSAEPIEHTQKELRPFIKEIASMEMLPGATPLFDRTTFSKHRKQVRIAYYSDSIIEGDLLTAPLRYSMQNVYGGSGVGMMPITSIVSGFRQTIRHDFSKNWETISFMSHGKNDVSLGITGYTFIPRPYYLAQQSIEVNPADTLFVADSLASSKIKEAKTETARFYVDYNPWVEYKAVDIAGGAESFDQIRLFYSHASDSSNIRVSYDSGSYQTICLREGTELQELDLSPTSPVKAIKIEFAAYDPIRVYGVSFDSNKGIFVDNYPIRGYSGMYFQRIHSNVLSEFQKYLDYRLVVLQYGGNISNPKVTDYSNYKTAMIRTIRHLQESLDNVPILIVSVQDRSIKDSAGYKTSPDVPLLVKAQSEVAAETGCAFWNLYEAMGGYNSMPGYVNQNPPWAGKDYTHFTRRGADHLAELLLDFLKGEE